MKLFLCVLVVGLLACVFVESGIADGIAGGGTCNCSCGGMLVFGGGCEASGPCPCICECGVFSDTCSCGKTKGGTELICT